MDSATPFQPWASDERGKNVKTERELADDAKHHPENVNPKHTQTASYDKESVTASPAAAGSSDAARSCAVLGPARESKMDSAKVASMQQIVENTLSQEGRQRVAQILESVESLTGTERLLLYLRLPTGVPPHDPLKQPINPLGSRAELQQTVTWIQTHLEVDPDVSLPKQDVYDEYIAHCMSSNMKPLSTADFGKVMKQVYPTVRPRRLGTRGNSRYCYAGLRKKIKLEVPQLPDLGESSKERSKTTRDTERIVCDWAETKLGVKFASLSELSRHVSAPTAPPGPASASPPPPPPPHATPHVPHATPYVPHTSPHVPHTSPHVPHATPHDEDPANRQLIKQLKRKIQTQGTPGRPKKNKSLEVAGESPPSTSYVHHAPPAPPAPVKHEGELAGEGGYGYTPAYLPVYDVRAPYPYAAPPRAHPAHPPHAAPPAISLHDYRPDPYVFEPYAPRDLSVPPDATHNLPINLSSDASLDLSTERSEWQRRRPPEPPPPAPAPAPARQPLPGKKLILETYQSETQASSPRSAQTAHHAAEDYPRTTEYLPKKMRAAEILGGKLAASRHAMTGGVAPSTSASAIPEQSVRPEVAFLEDPKNLTHRSKSTAAALAREEREAASPTQSVKAPTPRSERGKGRRGPCARTIQPSPNRAGSPERPATPDSCCGLDGISIKTGMICEEKHSEILNRERVISICNIDKHDLDDYLNEGNSQEHEEELLKYFQQKGGGAGEPADVNASDPASFLEAGPDPQDDHSQGKNEKISQLRELLAKNLKNQSGSASQNLQVAQSNEASLPNSQEQPVAKMTMSEGAFKPVASVSIAEIVNGTTLSNHSDNVNGDKHCNNLPNENGMPLPYSEQNTSTQSTVAGGANLYNGNCQEPQSPTTRTQQYDFVPISDGCHSPGHFDLRNNSPSKMNKPILMGRSLQTSPISLSTAASPFVSPRNTPVPRSRLCPRPIPKHNGRKRRNLLSLGVAESCPKQFAIPNEQKFIHKSSVGCSGLKYCQPMSAPPSPNILSSHYKSQMFQCGTPTMPPNGINNMPLNFLPHIPFTENMNGDPAQPLSADPLSSEVSQFFQESLITYRPEHDASFRSQSVPLKQGMNNMGLLSYSNTPVGSVPPTPVPNEFCDFGSLADTCDISRAGLNPETLDKIYDAIDSSNDVLSTSGPQTLLSTNDAITNGCDSIPEQTILTDDQLNSFIPNNSEILDRSNQFTQSYTSDPAAPQDVEDFLKRTSSIEFDFSDLVNDKNNKLVCNTSRSVPSTPLPHKRTVSNLQTDNRRSRELFTTDNLNMSNVICSKSVPSTPQLVEDRAMFSYSNRDFLINGNSVEVCGGGAGGALHGAGAAVDEELTPPLHDDMMILEPLTPAADLLADLDKIDGTPYVDI